MQRTLSCLVALWFSTPGWAGDVLFTGEVTAKVREAVLTAEGGRELSPDDLLVGAPWSTDDDRALDAMLQSVGEARTYADRLGGEQLLIQQLSAPIASISVLRRDDERRALADALALFGVAVDRAAEAAADPSNGTAWQREVDGRVLPTPWVDAVALEPEAFGADLSIEGEETQIRYNSARAHLTTALPALLAPTVPEDVSLVVDGRTQRLAPGATLALPPGHHYVHTELNGRILERWEVDLASAERVAVDATLSPRALDAWLATLGSTNDDAPSFVQAFAPDGFLVVKDGASYRVAPGGAVSRDTVQAGGIGPAATTSDGLGLAASASLGWLGSPDFYYQDPFANEPTAATVNAPTLGLAAEASWDRGPLRVVGVAALDVTLGSAHAAIYGDKRTHLRPSVLAGAGLRPVQAVVGWVFPYHPAVGLHAAVPLGGGGLELRGSALGCPPASAKRRDGTTWDGHGLGHIDLGVGWRL